MSLPEAVLEPGTLCCRAYARTHGSWSYNIQGNYMGLKIIVCTCSWGKFWTKRYKKDQKPQLPFLKSWEHTVGVESRSPVLLPAPRTQRHQGVGRPARPLTQPSPHPDERAGEPLLVGTLSCSPRRSAKEALLESPSWPLVNPYCLEQAEKSSVGILPNRGVYALTGRDLLR